MPTAFAQLLVYAASTFPPTLCSPVSVMVRDTLRLVEPHHVSDNLSQRYVMLTSTVSEVLYYLIYGVV